MLQPKVISRRIKIRNQKLRPVFTSREHFIGVSGGRASGKSWGVAVMIICWCSTYRDLFIVCGREIQNSMEESVYKLLVDTIRRAGVLHDWVILRDELRHKATGCRIVFYGLKNNPEAIKGLESATILWVDEADRVSTNVWDLVIPTMRTPGWRIIATWNPQLPSDPIEKVMHDNAHRALRIHTTYLDNPDLDKSKVLEAEHMKLTDPEKYSHIYLGNYRPAGDDVVIPYRAVLSAQQRNKIYDPKLPLIAALDPALYGDATGWAMRRGDCILEVKELPRFDADDMLNFVANMCIQRGIDHLVIDADGLGGVHAQLLAKRLQNTAVHPHNGGIKLKGEYANWRTKVWHDLGKGLEERFSMPNSPEAVIEMQRQRQHLNKDGQYQLISKEEMRKKGIPSPNLADALTMLWSPAIELGKKVKLAENFGVSEDAY